MSGLTGLRKSSLQSENPVIIYIIYVLKLF